MIALEIVTPERLVFSESVDEVVLPGTEGYFGVLPGHAPFLTSLDTGRIEYRKDGRARFLAVSGGFVEVLRDRVSVLAEIAERAEEIDVERARMKREEAESILKTAAASEHEYRLAEVRLKKALTRLQVAGSIGDNT